MSDIEARIAGVLGNHRTDITAVGGRHMCCCGADFGKTADSVDAHLAAVLVKELGLKRETVVRTINGANGSRLVSSTRYVTDWS